MSLFFMCILFFELEQVLALSSLQSEMIFNYHNCLSLVILYRGMRDTLQIYWQLLKIDKNVSQRSVQHHLQLTLFLMQRDGLIFGHFFVQINTVRNFLQVMYVICLSNMSIMILYACIFFLTFGL